MSTRRHRGGILSDLDSIDNGPARRELPAVAAAMGLEVVHQASGLVAAVVGWTDAVVTVRDDAGQDHELRNTPGAFTVGGRPVRLVRPPSATPTAGRTASGSVSSGATPARMARASRLMVEGLHDAELLERVWGDDLRDAGIVVETLDGADNLTEVVRRFGPRPGRRLGILLDHLIDGTKESRIASQVDHPDVLIRGHRFVDVWAAISPRLAGLDEWPDVPRTMTWKAGICRAVGVDDERRFWTTLLGKVSSYRDLDPSLVGAVEELLDFVTDSSG